MGGTQPQQTSLKAFKLRIELEEVRPKVWRRILVPIEISLSALHVVLLFSMGWEGGHMHEFEIGGTRYGENDPLEGLIPGTKDEENVSFKRALGNHKSFTYVYDFGDNWRHLVTLEGEVALKERLWPGECLEGENACPPEDVGGAQGYADFLKAIGDASHPEHEEMKQWVGREFDAKAFDAVETTWLLQHPEG